MAPGGDQSEQVDAAGSKLQLLDVWFSPYVMRVKLALAAKGIAFSSIPLDLHPQRPKSPLLLQLNPVHQKVPVLLHRGKPVCESRIICEYLEDAFAASTNKHLLPQDPYLKAMARFWADFVDKKVLDPLIKLLSVPKEEFKSIVHGVKESLQTLEERAFPHEPKHPFFGGIDASFVDVVMGPLVVVLPTAQGLLTQGDDGDAFELGKLPRFQAWLKAFGDLPFVRTILPTPNESLEVAKGIRKGYFPNE